MCLCFKNTNTPTLDDEEKNCLKNCRSKITSYSKVSKSVGFPIS